MKNLVLIAILSLSSLSFAGQGEGSCKEHAQKTALLMLLVEGSSLTDEFTVKTSLRNVSNIDNVTQWEIAIIEDGEQDLTYIIEADSGSDNSCKTIKAKANHAG